jgi:DNA-binding response OmpR family regulator
MEAASHEILRAGPVEIRPAGFLALAAGRALPLTPRELALLTALARHSGLVLGRDELYAAAWGRPRPAGDRSVDAYVRKLRVKLERALPDWRFIHTHFAFGYRFAPERSPDLHEEETGT